MRRVSSQEQFNQIVIVVFRSRNKVLVRKRPQPQLFLGDLPQARKAQGLDDEEKEVMANARSLVFIIGIPTPSAATSMSRTAIHARPMELRTMFFAASAMTLTIASTRR